MPHTWGGGGDAKGESMLHGWGWVGLGQAEYLLLYYFTISGGMRGYKRARGVI